MSATIESGQRWRIGAASVLVAMSVPLLFLTINSELPKNALSSLQRRLEAQNTFDRSRLGENRDRVNTDPAVASLDANPYGIVDTTSSNTIGRENTRENSKKPFDYPKPNPAASNNPAPSADTPSSSPSTSTSTDSPDGSTTPTPTTNINTTTYKPGVINTIENGLLLSEGLVSRVIAISGKRIEYHNGEESSLKMHDWPDGGDIFEDTRPENPGGWVYASNSEEDIEGRGGVGALTFDSKGYVIDYKMVLTGTTMNCGGGRTHFNAWISCEEDFWSGNGQAWQVDPLGIREPEVITLGKDGGIFESFAYDIRDQGDAHFFLTEDDKNGAMQRFTPDSPDWSNPWEILLGIGTTDYLFLIPNQNDHSHGIYTWVPTKSQAQENAGMYYPNSEGVDVSGSTLYFVCKRFGHLYELNLDKMTYTRQSTGSGLFDGGPDQIRAFLHGDEPSAMLYFTEDGGERAGIHARDANGVVYTILEGLYEPETTGLSFSPDGKRMYFAFQEDGFLFEVQRLDQQSFHATTLNVKRHQYEGSTATPSRRRRRDRNRDRRPL